MTERSEDEDPYPFKVGDLFKPRPRKPFAKRST
jgi:hypothetical protein